MFDLYIHCQLKSYVESLIVISKFNHQFQWPLWIWISNCFFKKQLSISMTTADWDIKLLFQNTTVHPMATIDCDIELLFQNATVISNNCRRPSLFEIDHRPSFFEIDIDNRFLQSTSTIAFWNRNRQSLFEIEIDNRFLKLVCYPRGPAVSISYNSVPVAQEYQFACRL